MNNDLPTAREFRLDPMYVRCGYYVTAGFLCIALIAIFLNQVLPNRPGRSDTLLFLAMMALCALAGLLPRHWRLRVDTQGIARRRLFRWDLWPWEDFAAERMKFGYGDRCFVDPARPFWRRKLSLELLTTADSDQVWKWISLVWQPAEIDVPEVLEVRVGNLFKRAVRCDQDGIQVGRGTRLQRFAWSDVVSLEVEKLRHSRPDFRRLTLELPGIKLVFLRNQQNGVEGRTWTGAEPDVIAQFLLAHAPAIRQVVTASEDDPLTHRELEVRLTRARGKVREFKQMCWFLGGLIAATLAGFAIAGDWRIVGILGFIVFQYAFIFWFFYRRLRDQVRKLESVRLTPEVAAVD